MNKVFHRTMSTDLRQHRNEMVAELQSAALVLPQVVLDTSSLLHGGMYARTIRIPAGTMLTGALTSMDNICIVHGDITVTTDDGVQRLTGYHVLPAKSGARRAGITHAETCWTTLIPTDAATVDDAECALTGEAEMLQTRREVQRDRWISDARKSYGLFVEGSGFTHRQIDLIVRHADDCISTPECEVLCERRDSSIHGIGMFAIAPLGANQRIAPARIDGKRCIAGRWTNHSHDPNAHFCVGVGGSELDLVALRDIAADEEITVDYGAARVMANQLEER